VNKEPLFTWDTVIGPIPTNLISHPPTS